LRNWEDEKINRLTHGAEAQVIQMHNLLIEKTGGSAGIKG